MAGERIPGYPQLTGFTLVELVSVILLLGVVSLFAMSRLVGSDAFGPALVAQELIAQGRLSQQTALSRVEGQALLRLDSVGNQWRVQSLWQEGADVQQLSVRELRRDDAAIALRNGAAQWQLDASLPLQLAFDSRGGLDSAQVGGQSLDVTLGLELSVSGGASYRVCIGATGYAYRDSCS